MRRASVHSTPTHRPTHSHSPPSRQDTIPPPTLSHGPKVEGDIGNNVWSGHDRVLAAPTPDAPHALQHVTEKERALRYSSASTSSGSTISATGSPYTPSSLPGNVTAPYPHPRIHQNDPSSYARPPGIEHPREYYYDPSVLQGGGQSSSTPRYYQYGDGMSNSTLAPSEFQQLSNTPMTYTGTDGQLYIRSPPRVVSDMGQDYRQYPHFSYSA